MMLAMSAQSEEPSWPRRPSKRHQHQRGQSLTLPTNARFSGLTLNPLKAASLRAQEILKRQTSLSGTHRPTPLAISNPTLLTSTIDLDRLNVVNIPPLSPVRELQESLRSGSSTSSHRVNVKKDLPALPR
jgi:hypothetical protein